MKKYDAIIIGSGPGGLAAGLLLAHSGKKVLIAEKNREIGGRISATEHDGFKVDLGVHIISRGDKGPLIDVLKMTDVPFDISFNKVRPVSSFNKKTFIFPHDMKDMLPPKDFEGVMKFLQDIKAFTDEEVKKYDDITVKQFLDNYTSHELAQSCIWMVTAVYTCLPSWEASAGEFMRCMRWEGGARASGYPEGGCKVITDAYERGLKKYGGEIITCAPVEKILIENNKVKGVVIRGTEYRCDTVISNGDIKSTVLDLAGETYFDKKYVDYVKKLKYSWSGYVIKIGVNKKLTDIKMLSQFGSLNQEKYHDDLRKGIVPPEVNLFLVVPSNFATTVAPEGTQIISFTSPVPLDTPHEIEFALENAMMDTAEKYIPRLKEHIVFKERLSIHALDRHSGKAGAGIGIGQIPGQVGDKRPKVKLPVDGLFVVGAAAGGAGVGVELAINSALEFFEIYKNEKTN